MSTRRIFAGVLVAALAWPGTTRAAPGGEADLTAARAEAEAARKASPSAATWAREAEVCTRLADLECARAAREQQRALAPEGERAAIDAELARLAEQARGGVAGEPASTRRAELDEARRARELAARPPPKVDTPPVKPTPPAKPVRIVKKWYFWVTLGAIAATAAAITAVAVDAARDDGKVGSEASAARVRLDQGFGLRF
jgi:hypothetical protein